MKEFADVNFKFAENGTELSKWVENTAEKGEIACYEQFLFFRQCFQKTCPADTSKPGLVCERSNSVPKHKFFNLFFRPWVYLQQCSR